MRSARSSSGDCIVSAIEVTGYAAPAARDCAVAGGDYAATGRSGPEDKRSICTFKDGEQFGG